MGSVILAGEWLCAEPHGQIDSSLSADGTLVAGTLGSAGDGVYPGWPVWDQYIPVMMDQGQYS